MKRNGKLREIKITKEDWYIKGEARDDSHFYSVRIYYDEPTFYIHIHFNKFNINKCSYRKKYYNVKSIYPNRQGIINQIIDEMKKHYEF